MLGLKCQNFSLRLYVLYELCRAKKEVVHAFSCGWSMDTLRKFEVYSKSQSCSWLRLKQFWLFFRALQTSRMHLNSKGDCVRLARVNCIWIPPEFIWLAMLTNVMKHLTSFNLHAHSLCSIIKSTVTRFAYVFLLLAQILPSRVRSPQKKSLFTKATQIYSKFSKLHVSKKNVYFPCSFVVFLTLTEASQIKAWTFQWTIQRVSC